MCNLILLQDFSQECSSESETDEDNAESGEECTSESEVDDENDASNEEDWASSSEVKSDCSDEDEIDLQASAEDLKKLVPQDFEKVKREILKCGMEELLENQLVTNDA